MLALHRDFFLRVPIQTQTEGAFVPWHGARPDTAPRIGDARFSRVGRVDGRAHRRAAVRQNRAQQNPAAGYPALRAVIQHQMHSRLSSRCDRRLIQQHRGSRAAVRRGHPGFLASYIAYEGAILAGDALPDHCGAASCTQLHALPFVSSSILDKHLERTEGFLCPKVQPGQEKSEQYDTRFHFSAETVPHLIGTKCWCQPHGPAFCPGAW